MTRFIFIFILLASTLRAELLFDTTHFYFEELTTASEDFERATKMWKQGEVTHAVLLFEAVADRYPRSEFATKSLFSAAECLYSLGELEGANEKLSSYLKSQGAPARFKEALLMKFDIAEKLRLGAGKPLFGARYLPKWMGGEVLALEIYDEITTTLPSDPMTAKALFSKGSLLQELGQWKESTDTLQHLIRRFPRDPLASDAYAKISEVLRVQGELEAQNPDILGLARLNLKRFENDFPYDDRIAVAKKNILELEETHAQALFETGLLYERKGEPVSAEIYYKHTERMYPNTKVANLSQLRLKQLKKDHLAVGKDNSK